MRETGIESSARLVVQTFGAFGVEMVKAGEALREMAGAFTNFRCVLLPEENSSTSMSIGPAENLGTIDDFA